ncbi:MAG: hypothetical protein WBP81_03060 [Solirubrobacteraceae bacterium]
MTIRKSLESDQAREAFGSNLASGGPFTVRIEVDANPDGFGGVAYVELGKPDGEPDEPERVIRYAIVGNTQAMNGVGAYAGAAAMALSWLERMGRLAEMQQIVDASEPPE